MSSYLQPPGKAGQQKKKKQKECYQELTVLLAQM